MIHFIGAGCGAVDLITLRGKKLIEQADVIIYAGSLINKELLNFAKQDAALFDSAKMHLEEIMTVMVEANKKNQEVVRLHSGDPSIYGAIKEQMLILDKEGICYDVCPGVSAFSGAAAALKAEYTPAEVSQTLIITRMEGRTMVPVREKMRSLASHQASMAIFLSTGLLDKLEEELLLGGYNASTPAAIVYKASWPDELILKCTVSTLYKTAKDNNITNTALIVVGNFLNGSSALSKLYDKSFTTLFREGIKE